MNFTAGGLNSKIPNYRPRYDDRKGLGYGVLEPRFQKPRSAQGSYPYTDDDPYGDDAPLEMSDEELDQFVSKVNSRYYPSDSLKKNDPFYNFAGNTSARPLAAESMSINAKSMSPLPRSYSGAKKADASVGGTAPLPFPGPTLGFRSAIRPTGTKRGWSFAPEPIAGIENVTDEPMYTIDDMEGTDERHVSNLRKLVRHVLRGELYETSRKTG